MTDEVCEWVVDKKTDKQVQTVKSMKTDRQKINRKKKLQLD